jgi:hypothetical protein
MRRTAFVFAVVALLAWPVVALGQAAPKVSIVSPAAGSTVTGPKVEVKLSFQNFKTVAAGGAVADGEGHAHLFVDRDPVTAGTAIPTGEATIVHLGAAPFDTRTIDLAPGSHKITAVLGDSTHKALTPLASASVSFTVAEAGSMTPSKPSNTGDGSLARPAIGAGAVAAVALALLALAGRLVRRRI